MKKEILNYLEYNKDDVLSSFSSKLIKDNLVILGVRLPILLAFAKKHTQDIQEILVIDDNNIFEIRMIKLFIISQINDVELYKKYFEDSINLITNWSLCDSYIMHSKVIKKDKRYFFNRACILINDNDEFHKRMGLIIMLTYFIDDEYVDKLFKVISGFSSNGYYSDMALAWLLSVLFVKYTDKTKDFLLNSKLNNRIVKMSIRKIKDSYRVSDVDKKWLRKIEK